MTRYSKRARYFAEAFQTPPHVEQVDRQTTGFAFQRLSCVSDRPFLEDTERTEICDHIMPKLNGADLVRSVRTKYPHVPVVYMSGYTSDLDGERLDGPARQSAFIPKPFFPQSLLQIVREVVPLLEDGAGDTKQPKV